MTPSLPYDAPAGRQSGTADFRLMPTDDFAGGPSMLDVADAALGRALRLDYTWLHPDDGEQAGTLLLGLAAEDGSVSAAWVDSWHQKDLTLLSGRGDASSATVGYDYAPGWSWEIEVRVAGASVELLMRNVVPERDDTPAVTYEVMRATWA
ncbi:hypothetical protein J2X46_003443 [Nocardioides sp. BE266]|uniref:hypothetical protein n=1 Tax=Nocardioides sp. BE266 TaxID=2817725 RepID=UPI00285F482B|nr:hypothetical protein [Nocardioides sp. BE266]MDR7254450.1 hypothetical protein [Nocardioides sp. BE266]